MSMNYDHKRFQTPAQYVEWLQNLVAGPISLSAPLTKDGESDDYYVESIIKDTAPSTEELYFEENTRETVLASIKELSPREIQVISYRYGFVTGSPMTLDEIATKYGLTRERIRQIEVKALKKLRAKPEILELRSR